MAPGEALPGYLLARTLQPPEAEGDPPRPTTEFRDAIDRLENLGLIEDRGDETFGMHRLVVAFALAATPDDGAGTAVEAACTRAAMHAQRAGQPARLEALLPHVRFVTVAAEERGDAMAANCRTALSLTLRELRAYDEALPHARRAWEISVELYGQDGAATLQRRSNVASVLDHKGEKEAAKAIYWEVLEAQERSLQPDDPDIAATCNNLGAMYADEDLYHRVLPLYEKALRIRKKAWESTPPEHHRERREAAYRVAESLGNMGALLMDLGRLGGAGPHLMSALEILADEVELAHERNAGTLVNLGKAVRAQMDYPAAVASLESALKIYVDIGRTYSADAARALANVGAAYREWAEDQTLSAPQRAHILDQAGGARRGALDGSEQMYGEDHPTTGGILRVLAGVCDARGETGDGRRYLERAEANRRKNFLAADAAAARALNARGKALISQGLYDEARAYLERALSIREETLGQRDFDTSTILLKLGVLCQLWSRGEQARPFLERALDTRAYACGETHPATELVRENLRLLDG